MRHETLKNFKDIVRTDRFGSPARPKSGSYRIRPHSSNLVDQHSWSATRVETAIISKFQSSEVLKLSDEFSIELPHNLQHLKNPILLSSYIIELKEDWDDNGGQPYSIDIYKVSINFILNFGTWVTDNFSFPFSLPKIYHGPNGSIDILFNYRNSKIFFNIADDGKTGYFYANSGQEQVSEGHFNARNPKFNLLPLPVD